MRPATRPENRERACPAPCLLPCALLRRRTACYWTTRAPAGRDFVLSDRPAGTRDFPQGHYLVPDTNAFLTAMDLFEHASVFYDVVVLQTVLEEVRNRSLPLYNRLVGLTRSDAKRYYVFFNEFRQETYVAREPGETVNDRNDRAVRRAVMWYRDHLAATRAKLLPAVVMLSDDRDNLKKAKADGILACSLVDYVKGLDDAETLLDMIPEPQDRAVSREPRAGQPLYAEYWTMSKMMTGVKSGLLHQGIFNVSPYNYLEGSVRTPAFPRRCWCWAERTSTAPSTETSSWSRSSPGTSGRSRRPGSSRRKP